MLYTNSYDEFCGSTSQRQDTYGVDYQTDIMACFVLIQIYEKVTQFSVNGVGFAEHRGEP
jgi:hypothetical protein